MFPAHIAGIPVEETLLSFGPILAVSGGIAGMRLRAKRGLRRTLRLGRRAARPGASSKETG